MYQNIKTERSANGILRVCINREEKRNALSRQTLTEIGLVFSEAAKDDSLKLATLTGAGEKAFAAGGDLHDLMAVRSEGETQATWEATKTSLDAIRQFPLPTIAVLNGLALGGGAELAVACDFRIARADVRIGFIQTKLAITPGFGGGADLYDLIGPRRALTHMLRAEAITAAEAMQLGLIDEITREGEQLSALVERFCAPIEAHSGTLLRAQKAQYLAKLRGEAADERARIECQGFVETWVHQNHWDAVDTIMRRVSQ